MNPAVRNRLDGMEARFEEIAGKLSDAAVIAQQDEFRALSREYAELGPAVHLFRRFRATEGEHAAADEMRRESDGELRDMAQQETATLAERLGVIELDLQRLLIPRDPSDSRNIFLEIRAGTGGDEAAIFAGDLFRMYSAYALNRRWQVEVVNSSSGEHGGYKEIIVRIVGQGAYSRLKYESGGHRVQRVPETETQGRIHTSACTIAVLPEADEVEVNLNPADLKIDTFRASGAGGQHVNKTDSAIRITHLPSGLVVECQDERSQHKNRSRAMSVLSSRLLELERRKQREKQAATRKSLIGSGDRSERIRTYNFPQGRITDHRIGLTLYKIEQIMNGALDEVIEPLIAQDQADLLQGL